MKTKIFKSKYEKKLFSLYCALDSYFRPSRHFSSDDSDVINADGNIIPLLFQAASKFWCSSDYSKLVDYGFAFDHVRSLTSTSYRSCFYILYIKRDMSAFGMRYFFSYENMKHYMDSNLLPPDFHYDYERVSFNDFDAPYTK